MPGLLLVSPQPLAGKTTIACATAHKLRVQGISFSLERRGDDVNAVADAATYSRYLGQSGDAEAPIIEVPAGAIPAVLAGNPGMRALIVVTIDTQPQDLAAALRSAGPVVGTIVNRVPARRAESLRASYAAAGLRPLAFVPEDRLLASPTVGQLVEALGAEGAFLTENRDTALHNPVIASIAADPGQTYFDRTAAQAVIVRSDKPDLQLAALNAGAGCLIVTGGLPVLSYVLERVEEDEIPLLRTKLDTNEVVAALEALFGSAPFAGAQKTRRIDELLVDISVDALLERTSGRA